MIIHVSFNRLSAPETKLLIYIYSIYQSEQRNSTSAIQFFWIRMDTFFTCCFWPISNLEISWLTHFNTVRLAGETVKSKGYLRKRTNHGLSMQSMPESLQICWLFHVISSWSSFLLLNSRFFFGTKWNLQIFSSVFHPLWHLDSACSNGHKASSRYNLWIS